jgi:hypothetical protein
MLLDARVGFLLAGALCVSLMACGGDTSGAPPITPPQPPVVTVSRVVVTPDAATGFVGDNLAISARAFAASGTEITGRTVTWTSLDAAVATVSNGNVHFVAAGTARITATIDGQAATATLVSNPAPLARIVLSPAAVLLGSSQITTLTAVASDRSGAVMNGQAFVFTSTNPGVATVSSTGTVRPVSAGTVGIVASATGPAGAFADTTTVTVGGSAMLTVALPDTVMGPGQTLKIMGSLLSTATAKVGGIAVPLTNVTGTSADLVVPTSLFQPCLRAGVTYPVSVKVGADSVAGQLAAQAVPVQVTLAPGQHTIVQTGLDRGCSIATAAGGTYVLMPYTWDQSYRSGQEPAYAGRRPALAVTVGVATAPATPSALALASRSPFALPANALQHARLAANTSRSELLAAFQAPAAGLLSGERAAHISTYSSATAVCGPAMTYGAVAQRATHRNSAGWADMRTNINTEPLEPWYVASVSKEVAIVVDSTMWRKMAADPAIRTRLDQITSRYDAEVAPLYPKYGGHPMYDRDANGHIIVMMAYWGARQRNGNIAEVGSIGGASWSDCIGSVNNEALWMPSSTSEILFDTADPIYASAVPNVSGFVALLSHEATHVYDLGSLVSSNGTEATWAVEGIAEFMRFIWTNSDSPTLFKANAAIAADKQFGADRVINNLCMYPDMSLNDGYTAIENLYYPRTDPRGYFLGCHIIRYSLEQAELAGISNPTAITRFLGAVDRSTTQAVFNAMNGTSKSARDVMGEFLLSWAADEVPGASASIQDRTWQLKSAFAPNLGSSPFNIPEATIAPGSAVSLTLFEPSAHYYQVDSATPVWITCAGTDGAPLPMNRAGFAILRTK